MGKANTSQVVDLINNQAKNDIIVARKLMGDEFIKYAVANAAAGKEKLIDVTDSSFSKGIEFLLHSPPAPGTFKLTNVEAGMQEKIEKVIKNSGAKAADFKDANEQLTKFREELEKNTKSNEGIKGLISESLKTAALSQVPFWKKGLEDINDPTKGTRLMGLDPADKLTLTQTLKPYVKFPDKLEPFLTNGVDVVAKEIGPVVQKTMSQFFAEDNSKGSAIPILDNKKLTPDNLKKFGEVMNKNLEELSQKLEEKYQRKLATEKIIKNTISSLEKNKKFKFNNKQKEELQNKLSSELVKLDSGYLNNKSAQISQDLAKDIVDKKSFSVFSKDFKISESNLNKVVQNIKSKHEEVSQQFTIIPEKTISIDLQTQAKAARPVSKFARAQSKQQPKVLRRGTSAPSRLETTASTLQRPVNQNRRATENIEASPKMLKRANSAQSKAEIDNNQLSSIGQALHNKGASKLTENVKNPKPPTPVGKKLPNKQAGIE